MLLMGAAVLVYYFSDLFTPVLIAFVLAYLLDPVVSFLEARKVNRGVAILLVFLVSSIILAVSGYLFVNALVEEFRDVRINLPEYADRLYQMIPAEVKSRLAIETPDKLQLRLEEAAEYARGISAGIFRETFAFFRRAFSSTLAFLLSLLGYLIIPVYLYYLLKDFNRISPWIYGLVPPRHRPAVHKILTESDDVLSAFVRGQMLVCLILAVLYSAGLYFIGIDLAIVIGTVAGITFIIPYFGTILGIVLSMIMALLKFHDLMHPLLCLGWFVIVQGLEGSVITPNIVGNRVGLNPVVALLAILIMGQAFGILGMLLAIPVAAVGKILFSSFLDFYRRSTFFERG